MTHRNDRYDLKSIVMKGPAATLEKTVHAQPALLIAGLAAVEVLRHSNTNAVLERCGAGAGQY